MCLHCALMWRAETTWFLESNSGHKSLWHTPLPVELSLILSFHLKFQFGKIRKELKKQPFVILGLRTLILMLPFRVTHRSSVFTVAC